MAWHRSGDKPLSEPMMVGLPTQICVTRPQWVKFECVLLKSRFRDFSESYDKICYEYLPCLWHHGNVAFPHVIITSCPVKTTPWCHFITMTPSLFFKSNRWVSARKRKSIANALALRLPCTHPSKLVHKYDHPHPQIIDLSTSYSHKIIGVFIIILGPALLRNF